MKRVCSNCNYYHKSSGAAIDLRGVCKVDPKDTIVDSQRPACRFFIFKGNHVEEADHGEGEILCE